ncbi:TonB-linked SusC/RagA family outer membrane protein [Thermoflavifilum aggregans]|uniref:TonB-linked SusC/RagA family outer membrane protein n=1 Tax=Thermoflavifilum aggregans TaxID=454188 RepID=A0A2M9CSH0_9BACT|nr:SusC/RagA family TonB-linked outer membrane protein [Thermoflavifilum aggregans]PJJ74839.1 TonB-linked SusC/RagA family outer membrane protein [Thermoflavifilum aggregans]
MIQFYLHARKTCICLFAGLIMFISAAGQEMISGKVISSVDQQPVRGASVFSVMTKEGRITGENGQFHLPYVLHDTLVVKFIGFETQRIPVAENKELMIVLKPAQQALDEVVVTALGVRKEVKKIGYAVQEVNGDELVKARDQNPLTGLEGKVAGLSIGPSAEMLRQPTVLLRGNQISLYVVDGVPISSDSWNINPDDIASISILKGPVAAALYGSRAQYGAILITTKKGLKQKGWQVEVNSTNMFDKGFIAFPRLQNEYGPGENQLYAFADGRGGGLNDNDYDIWGPKFRGQLIPQYDGKYYPDSVFTTVFPGGYVWKGHIQPTPWIARGANNLQRFLRIGFQTNNNISLSATGDAYQLRFSVSQSHQQSIIPNMSLNIINFNTYGSYKLSDRIKIESNVNINRQFSPNFPDVDYGPNSLIYNVAIWTGADWDVDAPDIRAIWQPGKVGIQQMFAEYQRYHNPWFMVYEWLRGHYKTDIYGYVTAHYVINPHVNVQVRTQITTYNLFRNEKMPYSAHPYGREQNKGDYREDHRDLFENNTDVQLNYDYTIGRKVEISGLVGGSVRLFNYRSTWISTDYLSVPGVYNFSNSLNPIQASNFLADMRVYSAYASSDISLSKYATIGLTGRIDKSSALPPKHNIYFYPSISLSSVLSDYIQLPRNISFFKIRASFATIHGDATSPTIGPAPFNTITQFGANPSGNSLYDYPLAYGNPYLSPYGGPDYSLIQTYSTSKPYNNMTAAYYSSNLYDPNLKTFNRVNFEQGFDIKFINNRLGLSATAFQYIDGPQILQNPISTATGYSYYYLNALKTEKSGYELNITATPVSVSHLFNWDISFNWSTFKEIYLELPPGQTTYNTFFRKGDRVDKFYGSAFVKTKEGLVVYDNSGAPLINPVPQFLGYLNGKYEWGIYNQIRYKQFSLGFQFDGRVGGVTTDYIHNKTMRGGRNIETVQGQLGIARDLDDQHAGDPNWKGAYVGEGVVVANNTPINFDSKTGVITNYDQLKFVPNTTPIQVQPWTTIYYSTSEANLMSKTFTKLREVIISYDFPEKWLHRSGIQGLTVSLVGRNLLYFYKDKRFKDVDVDQFNYGTGSTTLQTPTTRRFGFNIQLTF